MWTRPCEWERASHNELLPEPGGPHRMKPFALSAGGGLVAAEGVSVQLFVGRRRRRRGSDGNRFRWGVKAL